MVGKKSIVASIGKGFITLAMIFAMLYAIGFVVYWTQGGTKNLTTFYAVIDGKIVQDSSSSNAIRNDRPSKIEVKYLFSSAVGEHENEYTLSILPNLECEFDYTDSENEIYSFSLIPDLTKGFEITAENGVILIGWKFDNMADILSAVEDKEITVPQDIDIHEKDYFTLLLTSYNGKAIVRMNFHRYIGVANVVTEEEVIL